MKIGIDIDGVCYDFKRAMSDWLKNGEGMRWCTLDAASPGWKFYEGWSLSTAQWLEHYERGVNAGRVLWEGNMLDRANRATQRLRYLGHTIHFVTDRSIGKDPQTATFSWLDDHGFVWDTIDFTADKTIVDVDIFLDDKIENYDDLNSIGVEVYLVNRSWNQVEGDDRRRLADIGEFVDLIEERWGFRPTIGQFPDDGLQDRDPVSSVESGEIRLTAATGGQKGAKLAKFSQFSPEVLWLVAEHFGKGARKYAAHNFRKQYPWSLSYDSLQRHLSDFWRGELYDNHLPSCPADCLEHTESLHIIAAIWHAMCLAEFLLHPHPDHPEFDDRYIYSRGGVANAQTPDTEA